MALFDCQVAGLANQAMNYLAGGIVPTRMGNAHPNIVPYQVFSTADNFLILAIANDQQFRRFSKTCGRAELASDPRFATNAARVHHRDELISILEPLLRIRTNAQWIALLEEVNVPCGPINGIDQVFSDPQAVARQLAVPMEHATGRLELVASPLRLAKTPPEYRLPPPTLGQHTDEVLRDVLGLPDVELARLRAGGIIA